MAAKAKRTPSVAPPQAVSEPSRSRKRPTKPEKYTLRDAFDYFNIPEGKALPGPETSDLNNERCVRALAFLLHYCSEFGNENVDGSLAHGLGCVLEECASRLGGPENWRKWQELLSRPVSGTK